MNRFAGFAPKGMRIVALCTGCGHTHRCYGDGQFFWCRSCFNDQHGFDPAVCEWPVETA